jgi:hypothetical protein
VLLPCEHTFCLKCISKCDKKCPNCRKEFNNPKISNFILKQISNTHMSCIRTCGWNSIFEDVYKHEDDCTEKLISCNNNGCKIKFKRGEETNHNNICQFKKINCDECKELIFKNLIDVKNIVLLLVS